jgi:hypothetical protein
VTLRTAALLLLAAFAAGGETHNLALEAPPAARVPVREALESGVRFLVANQNADGSFGSHRTARTYELWCDVPGGHEAFQVATTALCWMGLRAAARPDDEAAARAQERALAFLAERAAVKRASAEQFYNVWAFGYGLRALAEALRASAPGASPEKLRATATKIVAELEAYQSPDGGWGYLDFKAPAQRPSWSTPFTTATVLVSLADAREAGVGVPQAVVEKALGLLRRLRTPDGNYAYSIDWKYRPKGLINRAPGSCTRNPGCELALARFDPAVGADRLARAVDTLVRNHGIAIAGLRRPVPHESWFLVSGYFYLYGHAYAALALARLPANAAAPLWPPIVRAVLKARQPDGSFWDYPTYDYHKYYGTGYALQALALCPDEIAARVAFEE